MKVFQKEFDGKSSICTQKFKRFLRVNGRFTCITNQWLLLLQNAGGRSPLPFFENQKKCPNFRKKGPDCALPWVKFSIQNVAWRVSRRKNAKIFPKVPFFLDLLTKCSWMCFNSKKPPLPGEVSDCPPENVANLLLQSAIVVPKHV